MCPIGDKSDGCPCILDGEWPHPLSCLLALLALVGGRVSWIIPGLSSCSVHLENVDVVVDSFMLLLEYFPSYLG
jgi:hypothetical protein